MIRAIQSEDAGPISAIYNHYVANTIITFEEAPVSVEEISRRVARVSNEFPWLVIDIEGRVAGYAYASEWNERSAYRYSVQSTIYLAPDHVGKGVGTELMLALIEQLRRRPIHEVIAGVALPNDASTRLHEKLGFKKVAHFREVGYKCGGWIDVGYWQLRLGNVPIKSLQATPAVAPVT